MQRWELESHSLKRPLSFGSTSYLVGRWQERSEPSLELEHFSAINSNELESPARETNAVRSIGGVMTDVLDQAFSEYRAFILRNSRLPRSIRELAGGGELDEETLRTRFSTIHVLAEQLWAELIASALAPVIRSTDYATSDRQEQTVLLLLAVVDRCAEELPLTRATFQTPLTRPIARGLPLRDAVVGIRRGLAQAHLSPTRIFDREVLSAAIGAAVSFWLTDTTPERLQTEGLIDQLGAVVARAGKQGGGAAVFELGSFVGRARLLPRLNEIIRLYSRVEP